MTPTVAAPRTDVALSTDAGRTVVRVTGDLTIDSASSVFERLPGLLAGNTGPVVLDVAGVPRCDSAGAALLGSLRGRTGGVTVVGANEQVASVLRLAERTARIKGEEPVLPADGFLGTIGGAVFTLRAAFRAAIEYIGELSASLFAAALHPRSVRWGDVVSYMVRTGSDALPIVALIGFLIGWILAFQGAAQLSRWGVESYVADAVGVGIVLELGPLMTAIILAGRSGAAFAAEIGTMKVNEEVDAIETMGLDRMRFLVLPKVLALAAMMPLLVVFADACGVLGGLLVGTTSLHMTVGAYLRRTAESISLWGFWQGMIKAEAYAIVIGGIGCLRGLQTRPGAQGVGQSATSAVVTGILFLILVDALLTTVFQIVG